ncbi:MAG: YbaB/EbfC family nucleoid-associated protein [Acidimicrobiia bacterium]
MANQKQINQMMRQVQQMQRDMAAAQEALATETVEGTAGGGMVTATVTGAGELVAVAIKPEVVDPDDIETLEDLVLAAVNNALKASQGLQQQRLGSVTGGLDMGALGGLLG